MSFFRSKIFKIIVLLVLVGALGTASYFIYSYRKEIVKITAEKETLDKENTDLKNQLAEKDKEIKSLGKSANNATPVPTTTTTTTTTTSSGSSIYDKIEGSAEFKALMSSALDLMQARDGEHYQLVNSQVSRIYSWDSYGAKQEQRNIYIGSVGFDVATIGSYITHEATHVYNVYVRGIYSYGTREQELPCYEAELLAAERLGAPANFISSIESQIAYWQTQ